MKRIRISQRKCVTATILVLTVFLLAPVTALAGEANVQRPDINKPATLKELFKKVEIAPNKPGAQLNYLFKFEVPVELNKVHPSVNKAAIVCMVKSSRALAGVKDHAIFSTEIPLQEGAYTGIVNVFITKLAQPDQKPELIDRWDCQLVLFIDGIDGLVSPGWQSGQLPIGGAHKPGTNFQYIVKGKF